MLWTIFSLLIVIGAASAAVQWYAGIRRLPRIAEHGELTHSSPPKVSIIVAAKNEEMGIHRSVSTMLEQAYPNIEVIVINDRSTDQTGRFLANLKANHHHRKRLKIINVNRLPSGWLGKNHALYLGAKEADGDWYLFADADVSLDKQAVAKAVQYTTRHQLDHLTLIPENIGGSLPYRAFHSYWGILGTWNFIQLNHAGIGAFNFLHASVYREIGTHSALPMTPDDDLKLGKRVALAGYRQQLGFGRHLVRIQWYNTVREAISGLEKNLFAFFHYRLSVVFLVSLSILLAHVVPFAGIFSGEPLATFFFALTLVIYFIMYSFYAVLTGESAGYFFWMPLNALLFTYCLWRSALVALRSQAVTWRGTSYSLSELRKRL